jgi:hypothetical protein
MATLACTNWNANSTASAIARFVFRALALGQIEREIDVVPDVARRQAVQRHAGHVRHDVRVAEVAEATGCGEHGVEHRVLIVVVDRIEHGAHGSLRSPVELKPECPADLGPPRPGIAPELRSRWSFDPSEGRHHPHRVVGRPDILGQPADRDPVDAGGGDLANLVQPHAAGHLEQGAPRLSATAARMPSRSKLSSSTLTAPAAKASRSCSSVSTSIWMSTPAFSAAAREAPAVMPPAAAMWFSLIRMPCHSASR